jgi:hypothetical protein
MQHYGTLWPASCCVTGFITPQSWRLMYYIPLKCQWTAILNCLYSVTPHTLKVLVTFCPSNETRRTLKIGITRSASNLSMRTACYGGAKAPIAEEWDYSNTCWVWTWIF